MITIDTKELYDLYKADGVPRIIPSSGECIGYDYPELTKEKQYEIIMILSDHMDLTISKFGKYELNLFDGENQIKEIDKDFQKALIKLLITYHKYLTEKEQIKIKQILERTWK